jgi:MFS family permease
MAIAIAAAAWVMIRATGDLPQWIAMGIGVYAIATWAFSIKLRDPPTFAMIWGSSAFRYAVVGFGLISFPGYALAAFTAPYVMRKFGISPAETGLIIGGLAAACGFIGVILGGWLGDRLKQRGPTGRLLIAYAAVLIPFIPVLIMFQTESLPLFYALHAFVSVFASMWLGVGGATTQDLVLPRMRGAATATFLMAPTLLGLALGPYFTGRISKAFTEDMGAADALGVGIKASLIVVPIILFCLWRTGQLLPAAEASRFDRARAAGEPM